jgi:hypothetical protein
MYHNITVIDNQPAAFGFPLDPAFPFMLFMCFFDHSISQGIQHAAAGASADDEVTCEGCNLFNIQQENVFPLFIFQGIDNGMCKIQRIQISPLPYKNIETMPVLH